MNRREFFKILGMAAPMVAIAPKTYVFAPIEGWHSDVIINPAYSLSDANNISAISLNDMLSDVAYDNFFVQTPFWKYLRKEGHVLNG